MADLRAVLESLGFSDVRTYLQSGNAVFSTEPGDSAHLAAQIADALAGKTGEHIDVLVLSAGDMAAAAAGNPFLAELPADAVDPTHLHVVFLFEEPSPELAASLDPPGFEGECAELVGGLVYLHLPYGAGRTKLTNAYFERAFGIRATGRNWNTVTALAEEGAG